MAMEITDFPVGSKAFSIAASAISLRRPLSLLRLMIDQSRSNPLRLPSRQDLLSLRDLSRLNKISAPAFKSAASANFAIPASQDNLSRLGALILRPNGTSLTTGRKAKLKLWRVLTERIDGKKMDQLMAHRIGNGEPIS